MTPLETQVGGSHYVNMAIQPIEFICANNIGYMEGNAIKYLCRWERKNGLQDLRKAIHYIELLIDIHSRGLEKLMPHTAQDTAQQEPEPVAVVAIPPMPEDDE